MSPSSTSTSSGSRTTRSAAPLCEHRQTPLLLTFLSLALQSRQLDLCRLFRLSCAANLVIRFAVVAARVCVCDDRPRPKRYRNSFIFCALAVWLLCLPCRPSSVWLFCLLMTLWMVRLFALAAADWRDTATEGQRTAPAKPTALHAQTPALLPCLGLFWPCFSAVANLTRALPPPAESGGLWQAQHAVLRRVRDETRHPELRQEPPPRPRHRLRPRHCRRGQATPQRGAGARRPRARKPHNHSSHI